MGLGPVLDRSCPEPSRRPIEQPHTTLYGKPRAGEVSTETIDLGLLRSGPVNCFSIAGFRPSAAKQQPLLLLRCRERSEWSPTVLRSLTLRLSSTQSREIALANAVLSSAKLKKILAALEANWQAEMEGYYTYLALADRE